MQQNHSKPTHIYLHSFRVPCAVHGSHAYILGGLDHAVDDAAFHLLKTLKRNGYQVEYDQISISLDDARRMATGGGMDVDDIPF